MTDYISIKSFRPETRIGLKEWGETLGYDLEQVFNLEDWAWLLFLMKHTPDYEDYFLSGKWATIQFLEQMLNEAALKRIDGQ